MRMTGLDGGPRGIGTTLVGTAASHDGTPCDIDCGTITERTVQADTNAGKRGNR